MIGNKPRQYLRCPRIVTAGSSGVIENGVVVIDGTNISAVTPEVQLGNDWPHSDVVDFPDCTIIPGLIDAHCHLTLAADGRNYEYMMLDSDEMLALVALRNLRLHLASGITTLRDNGGRNRVTFIVREAINRGYFQGPRLLLSGRPLTHSFGHAHWCNGTADGVDQVRAAVRKLVAEGADHIKIMASGGATGGNIPYYASYTVEELKAAVDTAHSLGRLTTAHCRAKESMVYAVQAGLDCIEHAEFLVPGDMAEFGTGLPAAGVMEFDPRVCEMMLNAGIYISYTWQGDGYDSLVGLRIKRDDDVLTVTEGKQLAALEDLYQQKLGIFQSLLTAGFLPRLISSSDAGCFDGEFGRFQYDLHLAVEGGMTPQQAIESVTRVAAEACGVSSSVGTLDPGKQADLVVVRGNPLQEIDAVADIVAVYKGGERVTANNVPLRQVDAVADVEAVLH